MCGVVCLSNPSASLPPLLLSPFPLFPSSLPSSYPTREHRHADGPYLSTLSFPFPLLSFSLSYPSSPLPSLLPFLPPSLPPSPDQSTTFSLSTTRVPKASTTLPFESNSLNLPPSFQASQHAHVHLVPKGPPFYHFLVHKTMSSHTSRFPYSSRVKCLLEEST